MPALTPEQHRALDAVAAAHRAKVTARMDAEKEAKALIASRVEAASRQESLAVRHAVEVGVPRTRVGRDGLQSTDYRTVQRVLDITEEDARAEAAVLEAHASERIRWANREEVAALGPRAEWSDHVLRVDWPDYVPVAGTRLATYGETVPVHGFFRPGGRRNRKYTAVLDDLHDQWQADLKLDALEQALLDEPFQVAADRVTASL